MATTHKNIDDITRTKSLLDGDERIPGRDSTGDFKITFDNLQESLQTSVPIGTVIESAAISAPTGYLSCNGAAVSRTTYDALFAAITANLGTVTISSANPGVVTLSAHGLSTGSCIELITTGTLPTNLSANTNYYVIYVNTSTFRLATSASNAIAGTAIDTSGGSPSGTHTLRHCPYGISGASNFLVPDRRAVVGVGNGSQTINTRAKTAVLGLVEEDQLENHIHTITEYDQQNSGNVGYLYTESGDVQVTLYTKSISTGRSGTTTHDNRIGMNYYIKH
ncbi:MAG: phage tail protein [Oscillospiraceae bacterium]|jgi:hypothetical protein